MSMIKDFLGDEFSEKVDESFQYSLEDLQKINTQVDLVKSRIERIEKDLSSNEKEKTQNRIESERVNKKMLDIEKLWYENIFPDSYQGMFNRYVPSILSGKCPFCGTEHLDIKVNVENCFFCKKVIKTKEKANLDEIEIERKNLEFERRRLQNNFDLLKKENANLKRSLREEETELYELIGQQQKVKKQMDIKSNDNVAKYQQLELQKQEYKASETNCFISESKILSQLAGLGKAVIISMDHLEYFSLYFLTIKEEIAKLKQSQLYHIEIVNDGQYSINSLGDRNVNESQIINMVTERFKDYKGYCFIVDAGMQYLFVNGKVDENINSCFQKTRTMQAKLDVLKPISGIREVFAHFIVECVYKKDNYNIFQQINGS